MSGQAGTIAANSRKLREADKTNAGGQTARLRHGRPFVPPTPLRCPAALYHPRDGYTGRGFSLVGNPPAPHHRRLCSMASRACVGRRIARRLTASPRRRGLARAAGFAVLVVLVGATASAAGAGAQRSSRSGTPSPTPILTPARTRTPTASPTPTVTPTPTPWVMGGALGRCTSADVRVRKEVRTLTRTERRRFVAAVAALVKSGVFSEFVPVHYRWGAHGRASFFPWHRLYLLEFEDALRSVDPLVTLPFCTFALWDGASLRRCVGLTAV